MKSNFITNLWSRLVFKYKASLLKRGKDYTILPVEGEGDATVFAMNTEFRGTMFKAENFKIDGSGNLSFNITILGTDGVEDWNDDVHAEFMKVAELVIYNFISEVQEYAEKHGNEVIDEHGDTDFVELDAEPRVRSESTSVREDGVPARNSRKSGVRRNRKVSPKV